MPRDPKRASHAKNGPLSLHQPPPAIEWVAIVLKAIITSWAEVLAPLENRKEGRPFAGS